MKKLTLAIFVFVLSACSASRFDQNLTKWNDAGISHYRFQLVIGCFCPFYEDMPLTIEVNDGEVVSISRADGTVMTPADANYQYYEKYATIERLFSELESEMKIADKTIVTYDPLYGFPAHVEIDQIELAVDDELSLQVTNFEAIK